MERTFVIFIDNHIMVTGTELAGKPSAEAVPPTLDRHDGSGAWYRISSPMQLIATLRASIRARVPVGYEDESGFHYGAEASGW